jgi:hypothetical protein
MHREAEDLLLNAIAAAEQINDLAVITLGSTLVCVVVIASEGSYDVAIQRGHVDVWNSSMPQLSEEQIFKRLVSTLRHDLERMPEFLKALDDPEAALAAAER